MRQQSHPSAIDMPLKERKNTAISALRSVSEGNNIPEGRLLFAVLEQAVNDLANGNDGYQHMAYEFLTQPEIWHAELLGIDTTYVHRVLRETNLL